MESIPNFISCLDSLVKEFAHPSLFPSSVTVSFITIRQSCSVICLSWCSFLPSPILVSVNVFSCVPGWLPNFQSFTGVGGEVGLYALQPVPANFRGSLFASFLISGSTDVERISALVSRDCLSTDVRSGKPSPPRCLPIKRISGLAFFMIPDHFLMYCVIIRVKFRSIHETDIG